MCGVGLKVEGTHLGKNVQDRTDCERSRSIRRGCSCFSVVGESDASGDEDVHLREHEQIQEGCAVSGSGKGNEKTMSDFESAVGKEASARLMLKQAELKQGGYEKKLQEFSDSISKLAES